MNPVQLNRDHCKGCYLCLDLCPNDLFKIDNKPNKNGDYPIKMVRENFCINCNACVDICPDQAFEKPDLPKFNWAGHIFRLSYQWHKRK